MIAIEIEAPIVKHRVEFRSARLPSNIEHAKIIVMCEEPSPACQSLDIVALARLARASFPKGDPKQLRNEFAKIRSEWDARGRGIFCPAWAKPGFHAKQWKL